MPDDSAIPQPVIQQEVKYFNQSLSPVGPHRAFVTKVYADQMNMIDAHYLHPASSKRREIWADMQQVPAKDKMPGGFGCWWEP